MNASSQVRRHPFSTFGAGLILVLVVAAVLSGCTTLSHPKTVPASDAHQAKDLLSMAQALLAAKDYDQALQTSSEAIKLNESNHLAYLCRGYALFKMNKVTQSLSDFNKAVELMPRDYQCFEYRASAYQAARRFRKAVKDYRSALAIAPADAKVQAKLYRELGLCNLAFGQLNEALDAFSRGIALDPRDSQAYAARGMTELHLNQVDKGIADASEGIRLDPRNASAYQVRSRGFASLHRSQLAQADEQVANKLYGEEAELTTSPPPRRHK